MFNLRYIDESDLDFITDIRQDPEVQSNVGTLLFTNKEKQKQWFSNLCKDESRMYLILESTQMFENKKDATVKIGYVRMTDIDHKNKSVCVGGDIEYCYRGRKYGKEMYKLIFDLCFNQLGMNRVWLLVLETNERAKHLYERMGFKEEGRQRKAIYKNGKYIDYIMMSILKEEYNA